MGTLEPQSKGPLCSNRLIGTLAVGCYIWYREKGTGPLYQMYQPTHQRPVYQFHIIRCCTILAWEF